MESLSLYFFVLPATESHLRTKHLAVLGMPVSGAVSTILGMPISGAAWASLYITDKGMHRGRDSSVGTQDKHSAMLGMPVSGTASASLNITDKGIHRGRDSSAGSESSREARHKTATGSSPWCGKRFFSQSTFSADSLTVSVQPPSGICARIKNT